MKWYQTATAKQLLEEILVHNLVSFNKRLKKNDLRKTKKSFV